MKTFIMVKNLKFACKKSKKAHELWIKAISMLGGPAEASKKIGLPVSSVSNINSCRLGKQLYPTPERAMKISIETKGEISAEELRPHHDFSYVYDYVEMMNKKNKKDK